MRALLAAILLLAAGSHPAAAALDPVQARALVDRQTITLGDPILLSIQVDAEKGYQVTDPGVPRQIGDFEVLETLTAFQTAAPGGLTRIVFRYRITAFDLGELVLPAIDVRYRTPAGTDGIAKTAEVSIGVSGVIDANGDRSAIQPMRPPLALSGAGAYTAARAVTIATALSLVLALLVVWVRSRRRVSSAEELTPVATGLVASRMLADVVALARERLPDEGKFEEHYERLGAAVREYLAGRYNIAARQRTALELRADLLRAGVERTQANFVFELLREGEVVRFRHTPPSPRHANDIATAVLDFLRKAAASEEYDLTSGRPR